jgi:vitamin B12 transporter
LGFEARRETGDAPMRHTLKSVLLAATAACALPAAAEEPEIVVTATRTPTSAERLPARVDIIDRAEMEALSLSTLQEALGADAVQAGGAGQQASLFLRGANSKHALALFDGVRLNDASTPNAQYDFGLDLLGAIERVEVLRGPASAIYGSDAIGGVVNVIPRRGGERAVEPFLELAGGSFGTIRGLMGAEGSIDDLEYGVSIETLHTDGYDLIPDRMSTDTDDPDAASVSTFTASGRRDLGRFAFDALLRARRSTSEFDTFSGGSFFDLRADDPDLENEATQRLWRVGGEVEAAAQLALRLSGGQVLSDRAERDGLVETSSADSERSFVDAVAYYRAGAASLTGGLSFERNEIDTQPQFANPLSAEENQRAAHVVGQFDVGDHLVFTAAARVDDYESFGTHTTWSAGAVANFDGARVFASYGTAFKAPSLSERFETSFFNVGNPDLAPEESTSWEAGADFRLGRFNAGASYYQTQIENLIEYDFFQLMNVNIGEAEIDGAEAYVEAAPTDWASLRLAYAWTDARNGASGDELARRPEHAWRLDARVQSTERVGLALSWTYVGDRSDVTYDDSGAFAQVNGRVEGYDVGALSATFDLDERAQLFLRVDNVTDEVYEQPAAFAGPPRSILVGVRAGM